MSRERKHKRKPKRDTKLDEIPLTPMIDVVFQLLIYFVWTFEIPDVLSQMHVYRPAPLPGQPPSTPNPDSHRIGVYAGEVFTYNDNRVPRETLRNQLTRVAIANPDQNIIVIATANSRHRDLVWVLNTLHDVGLSNVVLLSSD